MVGPYGYGLDAVVPIDIFGLGRAMSSEAWGIGKAVIFVCLLMIFVYLFFKGRYYLMEILIFARLASGFIVTMKVRRAFKFLYKRSTSGDGFRPTKS